MPAIAGSRIPASARACPREGISSTVQKWDRSMDVTEQGLLWDPLNFDFVSETDIAFGDYAGVDPAPSGVDLL